MFFKSDVDIRGLVPEAVLGMFVCDQVFSEAGQKFTITSVADGRHSPDSYHYQGKAFDIRIFDLKRCSVDEMILKLAQRLPLGFQLVKEADHIHVEFDYDV